MSQPDTSIAHNTPASATKAWQRLKRALGLEHLTDEQARDVAEHFPSVIVGGGPRKTWKQELLERERYE